MTEPAGGAFAYLCGPRVTPEDLAQAETFRRWLGGDRTEWDDNGIPHPVIDADAVAREHAWASVNNPEGLCPCGHPWGIHDVYEYRGDGTEMCCVTGCAQQGCPGGAAKGDEVTSGDNQT